MTLLTSDFGETYIKRRRHQMDIQALPVGTLYGLHLKTPT
jgi:hypothetical protein